MDIRRQMAIIVVIIYSSYSVLANESNCDCDVLQIDDPDGSFGNQNFTKQKTIRNGKPIYFSTQWNMIYWKNYYWSFDKYNVLLDRFEWSKSYAIKSFSFEKMCKNLTTLIIKNDGELVKNKNVK